MHRNIETDLVPVAAKENVGILPYFPLESGLLSGKYKRGEKADPDTRFGKWGGGGIFATDELFAIVEKIEAYGNEIGRSVLEIAIGWLATQPTVSSVIAGVTKPEQIRQNVAAASWSPSEEELGKIRAIVEPAKARADTAFAQVSLRPLHSARIAIGHAQAIDEWRSPGRPPARRRTRSSRSGRRPCRR